MLPYYIMFAVFAVGALAESSARASPGFSLPFVAAAIYVALMIGLRHNVGVDYGNYLRIWHYAGQTDLQGLLSSYSGDPIFYGFVWYLHHYDFPYWFLNLFCSAIFSWGLFAFANRQPNRWLAVAVAIPYLGIVIAMSGLRQATAVGFLFLALVAFQDGSVRRFVWWTVCAAAFHASAVLFFPLAGLSFARNRLQSLILLVAVAAAAYFVLASTFEEYARDYMSQSLESAGTVYRIAMTVLPALILLRYRTQMGYGEREQTLWRNCSLLALASILLFFVVPSSTAVDRLLLYLYPLQITVLSRCPVLFARRARQKLVLTFPILAYLAILMTVFLTLGVNKDYYIPYHFYPIFADAQSYAGVQ